MTTTTLDDRTSPLDRPLAAMLGLDWEKTLYVLFIVAALVTRFYDLGVRVMSHDESLHTQYAWYLFRNGNFQHSPLMHGPLKFEVNAFLYWLLGDSDFTSRLGAAAMGVLAVGLMYFFRRWLGRPGALVGAFLMLISPYMLYYSRYIRDEAYMVVWGMLAALCILHYLESREARYLYWLSAVSALFYATMEASFIYLVIAAAFVGLHFLRELLTAEWPRTDYRRAFELSLVVVALAVVAVGLLVYFDRRALAESGKVFTPVDADQATLLNPCDIAKERSGPFAPFVTWAGVVAAAGGLSAILFALRAFGDRLRRYPALDVLLILGVFALPQATAFPVRALCRNPLTYTPPSVEGLSFGEGLITFLGSDPGVTLTVCLILLGVTVVIGYVWDIRKFLISAGIFYGIYIPLFTTFFTNGGGLATGMIGSLGYWLAQQGVVRGNQPWYYYLVVNLPVYEFLPTIGALFAAGLAVYRWLKAEDVERGPEAMPTSAPAPASPGDADETGGRRRPTPDSGDDAAPVGLRFPAIGYFGFWSFAAVMAFSLAGEKMPWLTTHMTLPLILVSGWAIGQVIDAVDWQRFREQRAWLLVPLLPVTVTAIALGLDTLLGANPPFQGVELNQLQSSFAFVSAVAFAAIGGTASYYVGREFGWANVTRLAVLSAFGLLAVLTARTAFIAAYVNYDYANEFLVYAHGARGNKTILEQLEEISMRTQDGLGMKVAYDNQFSWPGTWYLRNFTNQAYYDKTPTREALDAPVVIAGWDHWDQVERLLGNRYYKFEYLRMVWPMQDYFNLTWDRIWGALRDTQMRQALWNIWFDRDYTLYGQLTQKNYDLSQWDPGERTRLYVRKDIAGQIWEYGVGPTELAGGVTEDPYAQGRQTLAAVAVWGGSGAGEGQLDAPRGVATAPDGSVYVADSRNHRIQKFDAEGQLLLAWGSFGSVDAGTGSPGTFNEPWGVAVGPDGSVYVADTWNHRVQKFAADGTFVKMWGHSGQGDALDAFFGPRGIAVDSRGHVFITDTGNHRVVVFDEDGNALTSVGARGFDAGFFDEPVGLALDADGNLFVADTWNQRVQVFSPNAEGEYLFVREWQIVGWYGQSLDNKPLIALDARGRVYVTDPEGYRVLVFDSAGQFVTGWGDFGEDATTFSLASGIAVDGSGNIYVTDGKSNRVLKFLPLQ